MVLIVIPIGFAMVGLLIRYMAYANQIPDASITGFPQALCRWDCGWYVRLSEQGYDGFPTPQMINAGNWAFFPFYPMLIGVLRTVTSLPTMVIATITSVLLTIVTVRVSWPLLNRNLSAYVLLSAFLLAGPFSVYFTTFYTEVPFFLFAVCTFVALRKRAWLWAAVFAALLSATRIVGVFIVLSIIVQAFLDHRARGGSVAGFVPATLARPDLILAIFLAPIGLFAYMAFLHLHIGDALAFSHTQRAWGRVTGNPFGYLWTALTNFPQAGILPSVSQQLGLAWLVGFAMTVVLLVRRDFPKAVFSVICLFLPLFAGMASMLRFMVGLAPVTLTAMDLLSRWRVVTAGAVLIFLVGCYFGTIGWMTGVLTLV